LKSAFFNKKLRKKKEEFMVYINIFYEGLKLNSLPLSFNETLYKGINLTNSEINLIKNIF